MDLSFLYTNPVPSFSFRLARMRNTGAVVPDGGSSSSATSAAATSAIPPVTTAPSSPPPSDSPTGSTPPASQPGNNGDIEDGNWRQLRTKYEETRARAAVLDKIADRVPADKLESVATRWHGIQTEASTLAKELGYEDADFAEAFEIDPIKVLSTLRAEKETAASRQTNPQKPNETSAQYEARMQQMIAQAVKPFSEHINKQISDQVMAKVDTEFTTHFDAALPNAPKGIRELVQDYVSEALAHDPNALVAMKANGDFSRVKEVVDFTAGRLKSVFTEWVAAERARATGSTRSGSTQTTAATGSSRPTLDDIINDPGVLGPQYK